MRISFSTVFQVLALIIQDVLAFEAQQNIATTPQSKVETPSRDGQPPVQ